MLVYFLHIKLCAGSSTLLSHCRGRSPCVLRFVTEEELIPAAKLFHYRESHEHQPCTRCIPDLLVAAGLSHSVYIAAVAKLSDWTRSALGRGPATGQ